MNLMDFHINVTWTENKVILRTLENILIALILPINTINILIK